MIDFATNGRRPKQIVTNTSVSVVNHHPNVTVRCFPHLFSFDGFTSRFAVGDRWNDTEDYGSSTSGSTRKKDFTELDGRWRSTNPSIFEEGFNKAEDIANKVKDIVLDQRHPSHDYSPEIRWLMISSLRRYLSRQSYWTRPSFQRWRRSFFETKQQVSRHAMERWTNRISKQNQGNEGQQTIRLWHRRSFRSMTFFRIETSFFSYAE